jgi:hypothetical protein
MSEPPKQRLRDLAILVRSKNAGPFTLTIDFFFDGEAALRRVTDSGVLTPASVAQAYRVSPDRVKVIAVPQANALKVSLPRPWPAGEVGDCDVAGGQQFLPLLDLQA